MVAMKIIFFILTSVLSLGFCSDPIVEIANGKVRGKTMKTLNNKTFYAFMGIPFAKPPLGELRFKPSQRPDNWEGILDDSKANNMCIQELSKLQPNETEDCLILHVYTPQLPKKGENLSLPIIFMIHGGAFVLQSADFNLYGPHYLMDYDVILVAVQYRLGFLGFLSTGDLVSPGNNGFKDQQLGLRWVQENIRQFGGDPTKVTINGQSAGAACVGYQLLSPSSKGLFRGAMQSSGSSLGTWALQRNPRSIAYQFGNYLNPEIDENNTTSEQLVDFFRTLSISEIKKASVDIFGEGLIGGFYTTFRGFVFSGVIEPEHEGAFLTEAAYGKFESGNFNAVPLLTGYNSEELLFLAFDPNFGKRRVEFDENTEYLVSPDMHIEDLESRKELGKSIRKIYVGDDLLQDHEGPAIKYFTDATFVRGILKQAQLESKHTEVYLYEFAYSGKMGHGSNSPPDIPGADKVIHGEDLAYIFHSSRSDDLNKYPVKDIITSQRLLTMWTNFIKYLNPTPEPLELLENVTWPKITMPDKLAYLLINETLEVQYEPKKAAMDEYQRLYDLYAVPPLDTY